MNKTFIALGLTATVVGALFAFPKAANAYRGDPKVQGPYYSEERHAAMEKAFNTNNYDAWKNLMQGRGRVTQVITKDNFSKFAQAHNLAEQGKLEEANKIRRELGLGLRSGTGVGRWNK